MDWAFCPIIFNMKDVISSLYVCASDFFQRACRCSLEHQTVETQYSWRIISEMIKEEEEAALYVCIDHHRQLCCLFYFSFW